MDGLNSNDGLFVVASTNFLDRLDPGLSKRPSRFDRKYLFPLPNEHERTLYCEFWRKKLESKPKIDFPKKLCAAMAHITPAFSFAFLQECFVATLLVLARGEIMSDDDEADPAQYEIFRVFKEQADILRKEINDEHDQASTVPDFAHDTSSSYLNVTEPGVMHGRIGHGTRLEDGLHRLGKRGALLPEMPYSAQKMDFISSKAYEHRVYK